MSIRPCSLQDVVQKGPPVIPGSALKSPRKTISLLMPYVFSSASRVSIVSPDLHGR